jgi:predicted lysophospholipase L1 biosynthesis ABC-type transport system permease subunit
MRTYNTAYRFAVGVALAAALLLVWINLAVGIIGEPNELANLMYIGVLAVGIIGAIVTRFRPHGMARALLATALAQALVAVLVLIIGLGSPWSPPGVLETLILNGFFAALFVGSALLFRYAAREQPPAGAGPEAGQEG